MDLPVISHQVKTDQNKLQACKLCGFVRTHWIHLQVCQRVLDFMQLQGQTPFHSLLFGIVFPLIIYFGALVFLPLFIILDSKNLNTPKIMHMMYTKGPAHYIFTIALFMVFIPIIYTILLAVVVILATLVLPLIYLWIAIRVVNVELKNDKKLLNSNHNSGDVIAVR